MPMTAEKINFEKEPGAYNIPDMAEIEPAMFELAEKMKDKLLAGEYDYIISDDKSGRIPSLIFKKIMEELKPDKKIRILHIAAGRKLALISPRSRQSEKGENIYNQIQSALAKYVKPAVSHKALVVSEYIHSGRSMENLKNILHAADIRFDIAALNAWLTEQLQEPDVEVFTGNYHIDSENPVFGKAQDYAGVETGEEFLPFPALWSKTMKQKGKTFTPEQEKKLSQAWQLTDEERGEYYQADETRKKVIKAGRDKRALDLYDELAKTSKNILPEDLKQLRQRINQTRSDIKTMAEKIVAKLKA